MVHGIYPIKQRGVWNAVHGQLVLQQQRSSQIDVRAGNTTSALLSINGSNKYMMTLEPVTSSPEPRRTLSHVGHYVSLDSWLASLTITFLI